MSTASGELLVFVYGSLMRGASNHREMAAARFVAEVETAPRYALFDLGPYPAMVPGDVAVEGELYGVTADHLEALDDFEGHPTLYRRTTVVLADGREVIGYLFADRARLSRAAPLSSGRWRPR